MNNPQHERSYDFFRDAEELRRRRADPRAQEDLSIGLSRRERYALGAFLGFMLIVNVSLAASILIG